MRSWSSSVPALLSLLVALVAVLALAPTPAQSAPNPGSSGVMTRQDAGMNDALRYLEELDKYYSQAARPRRSPYDADITSRQRRVGQNMASALEKLSQIKNYYNEAGRPRFGKRSFGQGYPTPMEVYLADRARK